MPYYAPAHFLLACSADDPTAVDASRVRDAITAIAADGAPPGSAPEVVGDFAPEPENESKRAAPTSPADQLRSRTEAAFGAAAGGSASSLSPHKGSPIGAGSGSESLSAPLPPAISFEAGVSGGKRSTDSRSEIGVVDVHRAQSEHDGARDAFEEASQKLAMSEEQLKVARRTADSAEVSQSPGGARGSASAAEHAADRTALDEAMGRIETEERQLYERLAQSDQREIFESFLTKKKDLEDEERRLTQTLEEHEETLAQIRQRLANPPKSVLPSDPTKARLYVAWKRALADREDLLRQARRRKHELMRNLKERHETQIVLLEMERRAAVEGLQSAVGQEKKKADQYREELKELDVNIENAREAMKKFRDEFEQLRVALLIDRMAKSSQVANLAQRRQKLAAEAEQFKATVEEARQRVAMEEAAKWEAKLAAEKEAGERMLEEEREKNRRKVDEIKDEMVRTFEEGFRPLLDDAEKRHRSEQDRVRALEQELETKEEELRHSQEAARRVAALPAPGDGSADGTEEDGDSVPDWKLQEFEQLKETVCEMWEQLEVPEEDVTAFLSECDLMAPYHPKVLAMYQEMHTRLAEQEPAPRTRAPAPAQERARSPAPAPTPVPSLLSDDVPQGKGGAAQEGHAYESKSNGSSYGRGSGNSQDRAPQPAFGSVGLKSPAAARAAASGRGAGSAQRASAASVLASPMDGRAQGRHTSGTGGRHAGGGSSRAPPPPSSSMRNQSRSTRLTGASSAAAPQDVNDAMAQLAALSGAAPPRGSSAQRRGVAGPSRYGRR